MGDKYPIYDQADYKVPDVAKIKKEFAVIKDSGEKRYLEIEVDVTHGGYINKNKFYYEVEGQAKGVASFFTPYPKPVLCHHISDSDPVGRTYAAAFIPLPALGDSKTMNDTKTPKSKIRVKSIITNEKAIEYILDKTYLTVSSGGNAKNPPKCSICNEPASMGFMANSGCEHERGKKYEVEGKDGPQLCYWKIGEMVYKEYSFINMPADYTPQHVASVVGFRFVTPEQIGHDISLDELDIPGADSAGASNIHDDADGELENKHTNKTKEGGGEMGKEIKIDEKDIDLFISLALSDAGDCPECDIDDEWEKEEEIKEAEALDNDFCDAMEFILGIDDKVLPRAGSEARQKMKTTFCGPNKTFPIPDCKHAAVALAMVKWPRVVAKYSSSVRARITSCVHTRAKTLGCKMSKPKKDSEGNDMQVLKDQVAKLTEEVNTLKTDVQEKDATMKAANDKVVELNKEIKLRLAEKVADLSIMAKRSSVKDIQSEEDSEKRQERYNAFVEELSKREVVSLTDSIKDLGGEVNFKIEDVETVVTDQTTKEDNLNEKNETKGKKGSKDRENWVLKTLGFSK